MDIEDSSKSAVLCPSFTGETNGGAGVSVDPSLGFERWLARFGTYLELKGIVHPGPQAPQEEVDQYEAKRVGHLKNLLRGAASNLVYGLSETDQKSYEKILEALRQAYSLNPLTAWQAFKSRLLRSGEVVDSLLAALRSLLSIAAPSMARDNSEMLLKLQFVAALPEDSLMKNQVSALNLSTTPLEQLLSTAKSFTKPPSQGVNHTSSVPSDAGLVAGVIYGKGKRSFGKGYYKGRYGKGFSMYGKGKGNPQATQPVGMRALPAPPGGMRAKGAGKAKGKSWYQDEHASWRSSPQGPKICWTCYQPGHLQKDCPNRGMTAALVEEPEE